MAARITGAISGTAVSTKLRVTSPDSIAVVLAVAAAGKTGTLGTPRASNTAGCLRSGCIVLFVRGAAGCSAEGVSSGVSAGGGKGLSQAASANSVIATRADRDPLRRNVIAGISARSPHAAVQRPLGSAAAVFGAGGAPLAMTGDRRGGGGGGGRPGGGGARGGAPTAGAAFWSPGLSSP